jgi:phosphoribosylpyrophosphate synthetase
VNQEPGLRFYQISNFKRQPEVDADRSFFKKGCDRSAWLHEEDLVEESSSSNEDEPKTEANSFEPQSVRRSMLRTVLSFVLIAKSISNSAAFVETPLWKSSAWLKPRRFAYLHRSSTSAEDKEMAHRIMYKQQLRKRESMHYQIIAAEAVEPLARRMEADHPDRFTFHPTSWKKFPDGTDQIELGGFHPQNLISGEHVLFLASFHDNNVTLSQFQVMIYLLQSFVESLTVVLPFSPVGTMERVMREGQVATAATYAHMFSSLPNCGRPTRLMVYDLHTLQNRFYLHGNAVASLQTAIPLLKRRMRGSNVDCVAFPDDGAAKRFGAFFEDMDLEVIVCGKTRGEGEVRTVVIQDGNATNRHIVIVDDLVQTGGTLFETGKVLKEAGAASVNAFVSHAVFPNESYKRFDKGGDRACFDKFWVTNSIPTVTEKLPVENGVFEVLDLMELIINDIDHFSANGFDKR